MRHIIRPLTLVAALAGAAYLSRARRRAGASGSTLTDVLARDLRGFVTHRFDPVVVRLGLAGGQRSPWGLLEHVGRTTGSVHRTPVTPRIQDTAMVIPLPYGTDVQWVRNVQAAGHCRVQLHETIYELDEPAIIMAEQNPALPRAAHEILDETAAHYLRLHILDQAPGAFVDPPREFTTHPIPTGLPDIEIAHEVHAAART